MRDTRVSQVIAPGNQYTRDHNEQHAEVQDSFGMSVGPRPFFEEESPHVAEQDQHRHVQCPTGEPEFRAHVEMPHSIEEKLEIPESPTEQRHEVIETQPAPTLIIRKFNKLRSGSIPFHQNQTANHIRDPRTAIGKGIDRIHRQQFIGTVLACRNCQRFAGKQREVEHGRQNAGHRRQGNANSEIEFGCLSLFAVLAQRTRPTADKYTE